MTLKRRRVLLAVFSAMVASIAVVSCAGPDATPTPTPQPSSAAAPAQAPTTPSTAPPTGALAPPTNVRLSGRLLDTNATVTPGDGEAGRVTVQWDAGTGADGFRIYSRDCAGTVTRALEVDPATRQHGPLQPCRPGGAIGVSAFTIDGESAIVWAP